MKFTSSFEILLVAAVLFSGVLWFYHRFKPLKNHWKSIASYFIVLLSVLLIRTLIFQPFHVVSGSLEPSVSIGDVLAVNPGAFGIHAPISHQKLINTGRPDVGDIALFYFPDDPSQVYVKRVIGTPGDHIEYHNKILTINGQVAEQSVLGKGFDVEPNQPAIAVEKRLENLAGTFHPIYVNPRIAFNDEFDIKVPAGHYFMMGDNRDDSDDSRRWGFVPEGNLIGRPYGKLVNWEKVKAWFKRST